VNTNQKKKRRKAPCPQCNTTSYECEHGGPHVYRCRNEECGAEFIACPICKTGLTSLYCNLPDADFSYLFICHHVPIFSSIGLHNEWANEDVEKQCFEWSLAYWHANPERYPGDLDQMPTVFTPGNPFNFDYEVLDKFAQEQGWVEVRLYEGGPHGEGTTIWLDLSGKTYW